MFKGYVLVSDMDGTLINDEKEISKENIEAIERFIANGGLFTIATGRRRNGYDRYSNLFKVSLPVILSNGGTIFDFEKEEPIHKVHLEEERKSIIEKLINSNLDIEITICSEGKNYVFRKNKYTERYEKLGFEAIFDIPEDILKREWDSILIAGDEDVLDSLEAEFNLKYDTEIPTRTDKNYLEIVPKETSKGKALQMLIERYNLKDSIVIAVGDNMNDKDMIEVATYGFAIKNGNERLIKNAKYLAPNNNEHAIAYIINKIEEGLDK
ncbi:Cof-type HAD-IIB family hydrolase [Clostridium chrysemydis]|uniref:Cof-type HAD-IIB family hydrolase n=1 Tax=Clostridium chrysemydis TaxID=2665504 RepID=UPI003F3A4FD3